VSAGKYYQHYLIDNNTEHCVPSNKRYTQDRINELIRYIVNDKMTIIAASKKVNMGVDADRKYYRQFQKNHNLDIPKKFITQSQKSELIGCIVNDKMTIKAALKKK
jgi:hypothetical protein